VFSTFLVVCAWAGSEGKGNLFFSEGEGGGEEGGTAEWVNLLRGSRTLARDCYECMSLPSSSFRILKDQMRRIGNETE
jgi:hypothetical protein